MTKQEIEKAIENGKSVWAVYGDCIEEERFFDNEERVTKNVVDFNKIFKTKAEAEHYLHHANITRTETLPFLTWEEFKEIGQISFIGKDKKEYILKKDIIWSNNKYTLVDCLKIVNETDFTFSKYFDYTEANFYKAYDECVRLFRSEE